MSRILSCLHHRARERQRERARARERERERERPASIGVNGAVGLSVLKDAMEPPGHIQGPGHPLLIGAAGEDLAIIIMRRRGTEVHKQKPHRTHIAQVGRDDCGNGSLSFQSPLPAHMSAYVSICQHTTLPWLNGMQICDRPTLAVIHAIAP
jgi:hypothetical protein